MTEGRDNPAPDTPGRADKPADTETPVDPAAGAFAALQAMTRGTGAVPARPRRPDGTPVRRRRALRPDDHVWSGARPDGRDPQRLGGVLGRVADDLGWTADLRRGKVLGAWDTSVGATVAAHVTPVSLHRGELVVEADSTAWATQFGLLQRQVLDAVNDSVGPDVVRVIKVRGPATPSWRRGPRSVRGRGPRDTYG